MLEIGFGMGEATAHIAALMPEKNFLCCEVHEPGVGALLKRIGEQSLHEHPHLPHDAVEVLDHMLPPATLAGVHVFFPDPWHKTRHNKRRLIQPPFVRKLADRAWRPAATCTARPTGSPTPSRCCEVLAAEPLLRNTAAGYAPQAGLPAADQVREPRPQAGPRRVGRGVRTPLNDARPAVSAPGWAFGRAGAGSTPCACSTFFCAAMMSAAR